jgi:hypothetical protein
LDRGRKVYFRESENIAIEMSLNQGRLVQDFLMVIWFQVPSSSPSFFLFFLSLPVCRRLSLLLGGAEGGGRGAKNPGPL